MARIDVADNTFDDCCRDLDAAVSTRLVRGVST